MKEETLVRETLMNDKSYRPYCGNNGANRDIGGCYNPRTQLRPDGQFICPNCKWLSQFPDDFVKRYKAKHNL